MKMIGKLEDLEIKQESLLDILPCGYLMTKPDGLILAANPFALTLLGYTAEELIEKKKFQDLLTIGGKLYFETHVRPLLQMQGKIKEINVELVAKDGKKIPALINGVFASKEMQHPQIVQYTFFDITQRKQMELEMLLANQKRDALIQELTALNEEYINAGTLLEYEKQFYKSIVDNQSFYIIKTDLKGNYTFVNNFFCKMIGQRREQLLATSSMHSILTEDHQACRDTVTMCFSQPNTNHRVVLRKHTPTGVIHNIWDFKGVTDDNGRLLEILCIGYEITELVEKQKQLQKLTDITAEQNKRLQNFTYIISHNIRSHVSNLKGLMEVVEVNPDKPEDTLVYLDFLRTAINGLDATITNLNEIVSIQSNISISQKDLSLQTYLEKAFSSIGEIVKETGTIIHNSIPQDLTIRAVPAYLDSILLNLLTNAIKYRAADRVPEIFISCHQEGVYKVLIVSDNGIGIDMERNGEKLFGMYKTFHNNADAKGLGLFITKTQVEAMKGKIEVKSELGKGTTFKVYFYEN